MFTSFNLQGSNTMFVNFGFSCDVTDDELKYFTQFIINVPPVPDGYRVTTLLRAVTYGPMH